MSKLSPPSPIRSADYEAIEEALMQSARGRWFLTEYARRNQGDETRKLLDAIDKLKAAVLRPRKDTPSDHVRRDLIEMAEAISRTRREIAAMRLPDQQKSQLIHATAQLGAIVEATEKATSDILAATEDIQESAWELREKGVQDTDACDRIDQRAVDIYTACSFQDLTGQRTAKVVETLRFLENRVNAMIRIWGIDDVRVDDGGETPPPDSELLNGPQEHGTGIGQSEIDRMLGGETPQGGETGAGTNGGPARSAAAPDGDGAVAAEDFETPEALSPDALDPAKTSALFS